MITIIVIIIIIINILYIVIFIFIIIIFIIVITDPDLHDEGADPDDDEELVGENSGEDIPDALYLPGVEFIEECHHDEGVEDYCEVDIVDVTLFWI